MLLDNGPQEIDLMQLADIDRELAWARRLGPVRDIVMSPCPPLLVALQLEVVKGEVDAWVGALPRVFAGVVLA